MYYIIPISIILVIIITFILYYHANNIALSSELEGYVKEKYIRKTFASRFDMIPNSTYSEINDDHILVIEVAIVNGKTKCIESHVNRDEYLATQVGDKVKTEPRA